MSLVQLHLDKGSRVATLTLNRPEKLNAFSHAMMDDFLLALADLRSAIEGGDARVVVLKSATQKAFCVGADLGERMKMNEAEVSDTLAKQRRVMDGVAHLSVPTIAVIEGAAFGGGLELALACDLRVASPSAQMGLTETKLGIIPGAGGTQRLPRIVGEARAKELIYLAKRLTGLEAELMGLVNKVSETPLEQAQQWARDMSTHGPLALVAAKRAIEGGRGLLIDEALNFERECYQTVLESKDRLEGLASFNEKRSPLYKGE